MPEFTPTDERCMARALELAARGDWRTQPNPKVGAVIARDGEVVAEAWHQKSGGPHAEALALRELSAKGGSAKGATVYVTLEPCAPWAGKRTPPCADALVAAGVTRVVVAQLDPHPGVAGKSVEKLRAAGLLVETGLLERAARRLNGPWNKWLAKESPYVTAKWAMSLDGKIAARTGDARWISGPESRRRAHALRGEVDAVLVGIGTVLADDPLLTRRDAEGKDPLRVVIDSRCRLPLDSALVETARDRPVLVATTDAAPAEARHALEKRGVEVAVLPGQAGRLDVDALMASLAQRDVRHLLVEGGGVVLGGLFEKGLVDRVVVFLAPKLIGGDGAPSPLRGAGVDAVSGAWPVEALTAEPSGDDVMLTGHLRVY